ncbi:MAG: tetratricopeptide repeat protein [Nitrosopumilaceae archaeon]|nr:tetratricopeptide repeat protein [Nitrosopumilaceae archaeon]
MLTKKNRKYWRKKALEATKLEDWEGLLVSGQKMIEINSNDFDGWATLGDAHFNLGNYEKALEFYKKTLHINNKDVLTWQNLGHTFKSLKQFQNAIKSYDQALDLNPLDRYHNNGKLRDSLIECQKLLG